MKSCGNSRDVKNESSNPSALFLPSFGIPFRMVLITGGYIFSVIVNPFMSIPLPSYFFFCSFGLFSLPHSSACCNSSFASPGITSGMKDFGCVIFKGSASDGVKSWIWFLSRTIEANAVFSWREYGARKRCREETRTTSTESSVDLIVSSTLNSSILFFLISPPNEDVASSFAVLILHCSQKSTSLSDIIFIFALQLGQSIATVFFRKLSISDLHFMSGHLYL